MKKLLFHVKALRVGSAILQPEERNRFEVCWY